MDIRELPHMTERVETGPVQFGSQDWPGVFIRGDNAFFYAGAIRELLSSLSPKHIQQNPIAYNGVKGIAELLESCFIK
jgi:hypothetical protein